jgi:L-alanine-DL-glutamate epimerase-like enolase superfamily enzyme
VGLFAHVRELPLEVERYELVPHAAQVSSGFLRQTTEIRLHGAGAVGVGEDVTYEGAEHDRLAERGPDLPLAGTWTLEGFSHHLAGLPLFDHELERPAFLDYRRWGFESAALDLALRQAGTSLGAAVGREARPLTFVVSTRLGEPATTDRLRDWLALYPDLRFKLDAVPSWDDALIAELAALGCVDSVDFKGHYSGTIVDNPPDPALYRRVVEGLPDAWLEDPALTPGTEAVLAPVAERVTWDAPIHSVEDIVAARWRPRIVNVKPSRFGSVERLFAAYDHCEAAGIAAYGGGQFELGPGRGQIQLLASLFHPDAPNDVAPGGFNLDPAPGLPSSPLAVQPRRTGFTLD